MSYFPVSYQLAGRTFVRLVMVGHLEDELAWLFSIGAASIVVGSLVTY